MQTNSFNPETIRGIQYQRPNAGGASGGASPDTVINLWDDKSKIVFSATVREISELLNDKTRLDWLLNCAEISDPLNSSTSLETREAIDREMATPRPPDP